MESVTLLTMSYILYKMGRYSTSQENFDKQVLVNGERRLGVNYFTKVFVYFVILEHPSRYLYLMSQEKMKIHLSFPSRNLSVCFKMSPEKIHKYQITHEP